MRDRKPIKGSRPYITDYGTTQGHCATPAGAVLAALRRIKETHQMHVVIEQPNGPPIDVWWSGIWGVTVSVRKSSKVVQLRRVK